ncbi:MAG: zinc-binding alcohol dehydrogenase family protein [Prevotellaceae bacterium]|nr:zinc-binding alcohol dehydrogenase family protein [Prevotellaceae bacterium]
MKALKIIDKRKVAVVELPKPEIKNNEVLLRLNYVGFCGSDLNTFLGRNTMALKPVIPGHEIGATVEAVGENVPDTIQEGMVVTVNPYSNCGHCAACRNGRVNACEHNQTLGVQRNGAMCDYIALPWEKVIPVSSVIAKNCAIIEPMSVGFHAVARGCVTDTDIVVVFGCGMVGLGAVLRSVQRGAMVIAVDLSSEKLQLAKDLGATYGINSAEEDLLLKVMEYTGGYGADVVIEAVGSPVTYRAAIDIVGFTGRVVCIGYAKQDVQFTTKYFVQKELDIRGSRNATPNDFRAVIRYMQSGNAPVEKFITAVIKPEQAQETLERWAADPAQVFRILVEF